MEGRAELLLGIQKEEARGGELQRVAQCSTGKVEGRPKAWVMVLML